MRYKDPDERDYVEDDTKPEYTREFVKARLHMRTVIATLPYEVREPLGVLAGNKLLLTVIDSETDLGLILRDGKKGILVTKE